MEHLNQSDANSHDLVADDIEKLKTIFPGAVTEGKIDFDALKEALGEYVETREERYNFSWAGKSKARRLAQTPTTGTLRPCPEESVDWDKTENLFIEGDNLEVLKLLQKSYQGQVKMIYIDPPYNTGGDFVYPDKYADNLKGYLEYTGQVDSEGNKQSSNTESSGRYHSNWLNMMLPRLVLAKNLLKKDGVIFISIDDNEVQNLRKLCDEIFGEENSIACFVWKSRQNKDNRTTTGASVDHEYVLCYGSRIRGDKRDYSQYSNPDKDKRGDWVSANMVGIATADRRPNLHYDLINPATGINYGCPTMGWRYEPKTMSRLIEEERVLWPADEGGRPRRKAFLSELDSDFTGFSTIIGKDIYTRHGTANIDELFDVRIFSFPKPVELLSDLVEQGAEDKDIMLDFFAGSSSTAHSVMAANAANDESRQYIMVQLPEALNESDRDQKTASDFCASIGKPRNIAELSKERIRRAAAKIKEEHPDYDGDLGFKVFKLDSSNIEAWDSNVENLEDNVLKAANVLKDDRSELDIVYELFLRGCLQSQASRLVIR